jgi:hypothetical protein
MQRSQSLAALIESFQYQFKASSTPVTLQELRQPRKGKIRPGPAAPGRPETRDFAGRTVEQVDCTTPRSTVRYRLAYAIPQMGNSRAP